MKKFQRFTIFLTLAAFLGLSVESFHTHHAQQTADSCAICQIAHRTPAILNAAVSLGRHCISVSAPAANILQPYVQFVFVAHGLSPPVL